MTLSRVGSGGGPDMMRLRNIQESSGDAFVYAAGGIRDAHDLGALRDQGVAGALVASSLHAGTLTRQRSGMALSDACPERVFRA